MFGLRTTTRVIQYVAAVIFFATFGLAQGDRGSIRGIVTDPSGANVPDTMVTVRNVNTGLTQTSRTGPDGIYNFRYLPVGTYTVTAEKTGFRKAEAAGVVVNVNSDVSLDMRLTVGAVDQTIEVSAAALMLETSGSNLGKVLPTKAINDLPLFITGGLRSNMSFIILTPGVIGSAGNPRIAGGLRTRPERDAGRRRSPKLASQRRGHDRCERGGRRGVQGAERGVLRRIWPHLQRCHQLGHQIGDQRAARQWIPVSA